MKIIDDDNKKLYWWNRNWFYVVTLAIVIVNIVIYGTVGYRWAISLGNRNPRWTAVLNYQNIICAFFTAFAHAGWDHVLLNMLCFLVVGTYLERKLGSVKFLSLVLVMTFFTGVTTGANDLDVFAVGFSGVNYGLYAYLLVDYCFSFGKQTRNKANIIYGAIVIALIYFAMCYNDNTGWFTWYPCDFMRNSGHYSSFLAGIILTLTIKIVKIWHKKELKS